jgi:hypothetical protein
MSLDRKAWELGRNASPRTVVWASLGGLAFCALIPYLYITDAHKHHVAVATAEFSTALAGFIGMACVAVISYRLLHPNNKRGTPRPVTARKRLGLVLVGFGVALGAVLLIVRGAAVFAFVGCLSGAVAMMFIIALVRTLLTMRRR